MSTPLPVTFCFLNAFAGGFASPSEVTCEMSPSSEVTVRNSFRFCLSGEDRVAGRPCGVGFCGSLPVDDDDAGSAIIISSSSDSSGAMPGPGHGGVTSGASAVAST